MTERSHGEDVGHGRARRPAPWPSSGQGYVGLPLAMRAVAVGHDVVGFDPDVSRVKALADGDSFVPDVSADDVRGALASGRYRLDR